jgi:hypothetical protein
MQVSLRSFVVCILIFSGARQVGAESAIAFASRSDGKWAYGTAFNQPTRMDARRVAIEHCQKSQLPNCKVITSFNLSCVSLAIQATGNGYAFDFHEGQREADAKASRACAKMGVPCQTQAFGCDRVREPTLLCVQPIFLEKRNLEAIAIDYMDDSQQSQDAMKAVLYLEAKYCVRSQTVPEIENTDRLSEKCFQFKGRMQGDTVYWSNCPDFGEGM